MYMTTSHIHRGNNDFLRLQFLHQQAGSCNIRYCIHGTHFMEMNFFHRFAMGFGLRRCKFLIHRFHMGFYLF